MALKMLIWVFGTASVSQVTGFPLVSQTSAEPPSTTAGLPTSNTTHQHLRRFYSSIRRNTIDNGTRGRLVAQGASRSLSTLLVQSSFSAKRLYLPHLKQQQQHRRSHGGAVAARGGGTYQSPKQEGARRRCWPLPSVSMGERAKKIQCWPTAPCTAECFTH